MSKKGFFTIYGVKNDTANLFFESEEDARFFVSQTSVTAGLTIIPIQVISASQPNKEAPAVSPLVLD